jgi:hypothetical protein
VTLAWWLPQALTSAWAFGFVVTARDLRSHPDRNPGDGSWELLVSVWWPLVLLVLAAAAGFEALAGPAAGPVELPTVVRLEDPPPPSLCVQHVTRRRDGSCSRACRQAEDVEPK